MKRCLSAVAIVCIGVIMFAVNVMPAGAENTTKGKLTVDGKTVEIKHAYAYLDNNDRDENNKPSVKVLLCDGQLSPAAVHDTFARMDLVSAGKVSCVINVISSEKKLTNFEIAHNGLKMEAAAVVNSRSHLFEPKSMDAKTISGRVRTSVPRKGAFSDATYSYDITFSADIAVPQSKKVGTKLPAGGGDLWKTYLAHNKKVKSADIKEVRKLMPPAESEKMSDEELNMIKELAVAMLPKNPKFAEGYANGDKAVLFITDHSGKEKRYGTIDMSKEKGEWVTGKQSWSDSPSE